MPSQLSSVPPISCNSTTDGPCPASSKWMLMPSASSEGRAARLLLWRGEGQERWKNPTGGGGGSAREAMMASPRRIAFPSPLIPPFYRAAVYAAGRGPAIGKYPDWTPELALDLMDAHGIEVALTSLAQPGVGFGSAASAQALARRCNDYAAELIARWPTRFGAFGTVPMWSKQGALDEIAH